MPHRVALRSLFRPLDAATQSPAVARGETGALGWRDTASVIVPETSSDITVGHIVYVMTSKI